MITADQYYGPWKNHPDLNELRKTHAQTLVTAVNALMQEAMASGIDFPINPSTKSQVSGAEFGGFRPQDCPIGAPGSAHKAGSAVDLYDPLGDIDKYIDTFEGANGSNSLLEQFNLYREAPESTRDWVHLSIRPPQSGRRTFQP